MADSLLSKHNGWITIDEENNNRKQAPETYQSTNPLQRNRLKPSWMNNGVNQSLDIARYQKYTIDLNKSGSGARGSGNTGDGAGVFDLRRSVKVQDK